MCNIWSTEFWSTLSRNIQVINHSRIKRRAEFIITIVIWNCENRKLLFSVRRYLVPCTWNWKTRNLYIYLQNQKVTSILINKIYIGSLAGHIKELESSSLSSLSHLSFTPLHTIPALYLVPLPRKPQTRDLKWSGEGGQGRTFPTFFSIFPSEPKLERSWAKPKKHQILLHISKKVVLAISKKKTLLLWRNITFS